jgi:hypothetical protein
MTGFGTPGAPESVSVPHVALAVDVARLQVNGSGDEHSRAGILERLSKCVQIMKLTSGLNRTIMALPMSIALSGCQ